jgi:hypothetical protein
MSKPSLTVTKDNTKFFNDLIKRFKDDSVLVGIPESESARDGQGISNAAILAINEFGSPLNNIPPRTPMATGIRLAQDAIGAEYKKAAQQALSKGLSALSVYYERIGLIASNSVKRTINEQINMQAPAESTLKSRESKGFKGTKALLVTGQLRNAITYVVKGK